MAYFIDLDLWLLTRDISPTSAGIFFGLLIGTIIVPELWRYYVEQIAPFDPVEPDAPIHEAIDYIVNDSRAPLSPSRRRLSDGQVVEHVGAEHLDAIRLLNEAANGGLIKLWGRRQQLGRGPGSSDYEQLQRPIETAYWARAKFNWYLVLDENGWPQTELPAGNPRNDPLYRSLRINMRQVRRVWRRKKILTRILDWICGHGRIAT